MALKATTRRMLKRAAGHHLGRATLKANTRRKKFSKATIAARKKQAAFLKQRRKQGQRTFHLPGK